MNDIIDLVGSFEGSAEWRRDCMERYPDDRKRNFDAAATFDKLAMRAYEKDYDEDLYDRLVKLALDEDEEVGEVFSEEMSQLSKEVGFHFSPASLNAYLLELAERIEARIER